MGISLPMHQGAALARKQKYIRPFSGTPAPLTIPGLFLFAPDVDMKLTGKTMRGAFTDMGKESLFKRMMAMQHDESLTGQETLAPPAQNTLRELLGVLPDTPFCRIFEAAVEGDVSALKYVQSLGLWETVLYDQWAVSGGELRPQSAFILEIERACKEPERLVRQRQLANAAATLSAHPIMREFLWPHALRILASAKHPSNLLPLQASVALEIRLSLVALVDVTLARAAGTPVDSYFSCLIPPDEESGNPTSLFIHWLKNEVGAETTEELLSKNKSKNGGIANITTLKKWNIGSHQPNTAWLGALAKEHFGDSDHELLWNMYGASRYLNFIGHTAETIRNSVLQLDSKEKQTLMAPWPQLPFNCDAIPSWFNTRYPLWLDYHRQRQINIEQGSSEKSIAPYRPTA